MTQTESGHGHSDALAYANACVSVRLVPGNMKFADFRLRTRDKTLYADNISKYARKADAEPTLKQVQGDNTPRMTYGKLMPDQIQHDKSTENVRKS